MDVRLGSEVFGSGGKKIGEVEGLVVNAGTKRATGIHDNAPMMPTIRMNMPTSKPKRSRIESRNR